MNFTLITGASEGLGVEFAQLAADAGHNLILSARSLDKLEAVAALARAKGVEVVVIPADLGEPDAADALWAKATEGRQIGMLVNNAGLGRNGAFATETDNGAHWAREKASMDVNMTSLTRLMKLAIPHMESAGMGRILNVASLAGFMPGPSMAVYHATKAYVLFLSEAVSFELGDSPVTVSVLCPGATKTAFFDAADMNSARLLKLAPPMRADVVARIGWDGAMKGKRVIVPGLKNKLFAFAPRFSPRALVLWSSSFLMSRTK